MDSRLAQLSVGNWAGGGFFLVSSWRIFTTVIIPVKLHSLIFQAKGCVRVCVCVRACSHATCWGLSHRA